jgi:hypothetical protein
VTLQGRTVTVTNIPLPVDRSLLGYHRRQDLQRLDHIANAYLNDPTAFWKLCEMNQSICPDALAVHDLIGVPIPD